MMFMLKKSPLIFFFSLLFCCFSLVMAKEQEAATFAGGCFWCVQHDFDKLPGVLSTTAGYTGGDVEAPSYEEVSSGGTGHVEAVQVIYDPSKITYLQLVQYYFKNVDPTRDDGQFCDVGRQYRPIIFYHNQTQEEIAKAYRRELLSSKRVQPIVVEIVPAEPFYPAEEYHQKYYKKHPFRYHLYRYNCGRDKRLKELWGS